MNSKLLSSLLLAGLAAGSLAQAQRLEVLLTPGQANALNEEARELYTRAVFAADRVNYRDARELLAAAAAADPQAIELQFLLAKEARGRAEITYGDESLQNYDLAATALRRLLANPALGPEDRIRVARESERVTEGKETLRARDDARLKDGFDLVMQIHQERRLVSGLATMAEQTSTIEGVLNPAQQETETTTLTKEQIWPALGAPGLAIALPQLPQQQGFGEFGGGFGYDPALGGGFDPTIGGGFDPSMGGAPQPFGAQPYGGQPYGGQSYGAQPFGGQPYGGQPAASGDPFATNPFGQPPGGQPFPGSQQQPPQGAPMPF